MRRYGNGNGAGSRQDGFRRHLQGERGVSLARASVGSPAETVYSSPNHMLTRPPLAHKTPHARSQTSSLSLSLVSLSHPCSHGPSREIRIPGRGCRGRALVQGQCPNAPICSISLIVSQQSPRFARVKRSYTAEQVVSKRGTVSISYPSNIMAKKAFKLFSERFKSGTPSHTYGA
jgi:hypothetical protein